MRTREKIDNAILAKDIKDLSEKIGRIPRQDDYKREGTFGLNTLLLRKPWNQWLSEIFGQINEAHKTKRERATDLEILLDIKQVCDKLGKSPTQTEYKVAGKHPLGTMLRHKKWNEWLMLATGTVNYNRAEDSRTKRIDDQELANDVRQVAAKLGHTPTRGEYDEFGHFSSDTIVARKPWAEFIQKVCGLEPSIVVPINRAKATDEELLEQLKRLTKTLNRTPLKEDLGGENGFGYTAYVRAFGTFGNALVAAGLIDSLNRYCVPREELIAELKRVFALLGHTPSETEFLANSPIRSNGSIYSEFGSWTQGLLAAGIPVTKAQHVSIDEIKTALQKWYVENNDDDSCLEYWKIRKAKKNKRFPYSCVTISAKFHPMSWEEIMHECGFPNYITKDYYVSGRRRGNHTGVDGNEYLSTLEQEIGDYLFELKNSGKILDYEYEVKVCPNKAWTCDFKVVFPSDHILWLEADGLRGNRRNPYSSGNNEKIQFYIEKGFDYRVISYSSPDVRRAVYGALFV